MTREPARRRARRSRHGRRLRATDGDFPGAAVGAERLAAVVDTVASRFVASAGSVVLTESDAFRETPYFSTELTDMPSELAIREATPDEVANGKLLGSYRRGQDGQLVVVFYSRPLLLWADDPEEMHRLVRQTLIEQLAQAAGIDPDDLDQEDD